MAWTHAEQLFTGLVIAGQAIVNWSGGNDSSTYQQLLDFDFLAAIPTASPVNLNVVCVTAAIEVTSFPSVGGSTIVGVNVQDHNRYPAIIARVESPGRFVSKTIEIRNQLTVLPQLHWVTVGPVVGGYEAGVAPGSSARLSLTKGGLYGTRLHMFGKGRFTGRLRWSYHFCFANIATTGYVASCGAESWQG